MTRKRAIMQLMDAILTAGAEVGNVSLWCRVNGVDRRTFYRHRARARAEGQWQPRSRRPKTTPHATPEPVVAEILRLRRVLAPDNGADFIGDQLAVTALAQDWAALDWTVPSRATINRVLARHGLLVSNPRKRPRSSWRRFAYARPRDCYQIDATETVLTDATKVVVFDVIDDCTRLLVACRAAPAETAAAAIEAITAAFDECGAPGIVLSDNGSAFTSRNRHDNTGPSQFARTVTAAGTRLIHSSPYHPQTCGKVERHHQTLKKWLTHQPTPPATLEDLQTLLDTYREHYNTRRPHSAIGRRTPHHAWNHAEVHGGPAHLPIQTDATVHQLKVTREGTVRLGRRMTLLIGRDRTGHTITVIRDADRATAYTTNGDPIGYIHLNHAKTWQGALTPAA